MCWLIDFPSAPMRWTMAKICDCADPDGTNIFPSVPTICDETNLSASAVRAALAAFEQSGILAVKENKFGNRYGKTTVVREIDTDLLRLISGERKKGAPKKKSAYVLALVDVVVMPGVQSVQHPDAAAPSLIEKPVTQLTEMKVWAVVLRDRAPAKMQKKKRKPRTLALTDAASEKNATPPTGGGAKHDAPLHGVDGQNIGHPSTRWSLPIQEMEAAPPPGGANPSLDPSRYPPPLPPDGGRGRSRKRSNEVDDAIRTVLSQRPEDVKWVFAVERVLAPLVRQRRLDAPSLEGSLKALADWVSEKGLTQVEADALVVELLDTRKFTVKPSDIEGAVKARLGRRGAPVVLSGDTDLMLRWPDVLAVLNTLIGPDRTQQAFSTFVIDRIRPNPAKKVVIAELATHLDVKRREVDLAFSSHLRAALAAVFPGVTDVWLATRKAAA